MKPILTHIKQLRGKLGTLWWYTLLAFVVNRLGDVINVFIGLYLVPRLLPGEDLGALLPLMKIGAVFSIPLALLLLPVAKYLSYFVAKNELGKAKALLIDSLAVSAVFAVGVTCWIFSKGDALLLRLHVSDARLLWPIAGFAVLVCISPIVNAAMRALQYFKTMLISGMVGPYVRLLGMILLLTPLGAFGYLLTQLATATSSVLVMLVVLLFVLHRLGRRESWWRHWREMAWYALPLLVFSLAGRLQEPVEALVIRQRLPLVDSEGYYYATMLGAIPGYFTGAMVPFLWPIISDRFERGLPTGKLLFHSMFFNFAIGLVFVLLFALCMPWFFTLPGPWHGSEAYAGFVWQAALIGIFKMTGTIFTAHETACRRFKFMYYVVPIMLLECAVLYILPGWSLFKRYLPLGWWEWVDARYSPTLQGFVTIMLVANGLVALGMVVEWRRRGAGK
ncbi:MAG: hypothetical protein GX230_09290 [Lentisphaerae bacterium]|jgi:O-antigen/teichoic acid export membrane protein|nr:hypothetical protein [Lentisphaerota bacterium]